MAAQYHLPGAFWQKDARRWGVGPGRGGSNLAGTPAPDGDPQKGDDLTRAGAIRENAGLSGDFAAVVDIAGRNQKKIRTGNCKGVQVFDLAVLPEEGASGSKARSERCADHYALVVDARGFADFIAGKRLDFHDAAGFGPEEGVEIHVGEDAVNHVAGEIGKAGNLPAIVDGHRRVESAAAEVANVDRLAVLPKESVLRTECSDGDVAEAGNSDDLAAIVDCRGGAIGIDVERRKLLDLAGCRTVNHGFELEHLWKTASGIVNCVFRPADREALAIDAGGESIVAAEGRKRAHHAIVDYEPDARKSRRREKHRAGKFLAQRIEGIGKLGNACDHAAIIFDGPADVAVRSAEGAEVGRRGGGPDCSVDISVARDGEAHRRPDVVDGVAGADRSSERAQGNDLVAGKAMNRKLILRAEAGGDGQRKKQGQRGDVLQCPELHFSSLCVFAGRPAKNGCDLWFFGSRLAEARFLLKDRRT